MIKREELTNPNSCMSRAQDEEMTFVLLGRDSAAPVAIRAWVKERIRLGKNKMGDVQVVEALVQADAWEAPEKSVAIPAAQPAPGWISLFDERPETDKWCWTIIGKTVQHVPAKLNDDEDDNPVWEWMNEGDEAPFNVVTHWQYVALPAPPGPTQEPK